MTIQHTASIERPSLDHTQRFAGFDQALAEAAVVRHDQLRGLPDADDDPVVAAQREALRQTLADITDARQRLAVGTFGTCTRCRQPIAAARLELRPWATTCVGCGRH